MSELTEQDQDLDDQLMIDEESLQAKSDDISALLQKNEDITVRTSCRFFVYLAMQVCLDLTLDMSVYF